MESVTIVCCYNDIEQYKTLLASISSQNIEVEVYGIDNTKNAYPSASAALNFALKKINTQFVIFSHQDILFPDEDALSVFIDDLKKIGENDIIGVAGRKGRELISYTNIKHGAERKFAGGKRVESMMECDVLDECFFGGKTLYFKKFPFEEKICNNWHLYAVEKCIMTKIHKNKVYISKATLIHNSTGKINGIYSKQFYKLSKKYSKDISFLNTNCAYASTRAPSREIAFIKRQISIALGRY